MKPTTLAALLIVALVALATTRTAHAQKACDYAVPPSGGAFDVAVHPAYLTSLQFPDKIGTANTSDLGAYEIKRDEPRGLLIRPRSAKSEAANITVQSGAIRISVALRVAADAKDACALVTFTATTEEEARARAIDEAVAARTAALETQLAALQREQADRVGAALDDAIADRAAQRLDLYKLGAVARNDAGLVVWVMRQANLGRDVLVNVELENRSGAAIRVRAIELRQGDRVVSSRARLVGGGADGTVGTVGRGAKVRGVVLARDLTPSKDLVLVVVPVDGAPVTVKALGLR